MNQKKARKFRKQAKYNPADDPIHKRKYHVLVCKKVPKVDGKALSTTRTNCGHMISCKGSRLEYRRLKKQYKAGLLWSKQ